MKRVFFTCILLMNLSHLFAQEQSDSIIVKKEFGTVFLKDGTKLSPRLLLELTESNKEAYKEMKIAKQNFDLASVFGFAGGFMVGWPIGTALGGGKPNWAMAGVGAGLIAISIPFSTAYTRHAKNAVRAYNSGLKQLGLNKAEVKFGLTFNGVGVKIAF